MIRNERIAWNTGMIAGLLLKARSDGMYRLVAQPQLDENGNYTNVILLLEDGEPVMTVTVDMYGEFETCDEDFMAGTICSLRKGHRGDHGTLCHWCGFDWYSEGHAEGCRYYQPEEEGLDDENLRTWKASIEAMGLYIAPEDDYRGGGGPGEDGFE